MKEAEVFQLKASLCVCNRTRDHPSEVHCRDRTQPRRHTQENNYCRLDWSKHEGAFSELGIQFTSIVEVMSGRPPGG